MESRWTDLSISHYLLLGKISTIKLNHEGLDFRLVHWEQSSFTALKLLDLLVVKMPPQVHEVETRIMMRSDTRSH